MHTINRLWVVFLIVLSFHMHGRAQVFGGNPASIRWKQINTDTVRIVFPDGLDSVAQRISALTHHMQQHNSATIGPLNRKVSIVLQSGTTFPNGYVGLGPYRSEFYLMPPQDPLELGAQRWWDNLAVHEFRHVQQYSNFRHGLSKFASILFGQDGQALTNAASVPDWFFEGDAVYNETLLSKQGRGRLPSFFNGYKSLFYDRRQYSYMKLRNGSLKHYVPDHYPLGYMLVSYGREKYGEDFWKSVTQDAVRFKPLLYPLQGAVKKYAGISYKQFVQNAFQYYQQQWARSGHDSVNWLTPVAVNNVINYQYPYKAVNGSLIVLKNSFKKIPAFYEIRADGTERKIAVRDIAYDSYFSYNNGRIAYAGLRSDTRWGNNEFSDISVLEVEDGSTRQITHQGRYFSPDISHDGNKVVTTAYSQAQQSEIVVMDVRGKVIRKVEQSQGQVFSFPKFSADDRYIYWLNRDPAGQMAIQRQSVTGGEMETILPFANRILSYLVVQGDTLLYTCSNKGNDEIWGYTVASGKHYQLAVYQTGLYQAALDDKGRLVSAVFTSAGYRLGAIKPVWRVISPADTLQGVYVSKPFNSFLNNTLTVVTFNNDSVGPYHKAFRLFNFHSWDPDYSDPDFTFTLYGENVLNTFQNQIYYQYNENERFSRLGYTGTYGGWYVQPFAGISRTFDRSLYYRNDTFFNWNETNARIGLRLPLTFSGNKQYRSLSFSSSYNLTDRTWTGMAKRLLRSWPFYNYLESRIQYSGQIQAAAQHIYPHWAQSLLVQYRNLLNSSMQARQLLLSGALYLPGIASSHSLVLNAAWQSRDTVQDYSFESNFPFSRGYLAVNYPRMWKLGANYHLPLWLPDWGVGQIVYFRRVRANVFYDITGGKSLQSGQTRQYKTAGAELYFDTKWWNQQLTTFGIRYSHLLDNEFSGPSHPNVWEFIWPVNLFNR